MYIKPLPSFGNGTMYVVEVVGGKPPYNWSITGEAFLLTYAATDDGINFVESLSETAQVGDVEELTVIDSEGVEYSIYCSVCSNINCCGDETILSFNTSNKTEVMNGMSIPISIVGGCPPFQCITEYEEFSFMYDLTNIRINYLSYNANDTIDCTITVLSHCGEEDYIETTITGISRPLS